MKGESGYGGDSMGGQKGPRQGQGGFTGPKPATSSKPSPEHNHMTANNQGGTSQGARPMVEPKAMR